jgi:hypothetical protein
LWFNAEKKLREERNVEHTWDTWMSFKKYPPSGGQRRDDSFFLRRFEGSEHNTPSDEIHQIEDYVQCEQKRTTSQSQNLPYVSSLLMEHQLELFVRCLGRVHDHCRRDGKMRRLFLNRSMRFNLLRGVYEADTLSSMFLYVFVHYGYLICGVWSVIWLLSFFILW